MVENIATVYNITVFNINSGMAFRIIYLYVTMLNAVVIFLAYLTENERCNPATSS